MGYDNVIETFEHDGCTVRVGLEDEPGIGDPRDADNPSLLYCWHPNYVLGDEQFTPNDYEAIEDAETYLREQRGAVGPILPLYLLDHSGISMTVEPSPFDPGGWDTTHVGYICAPEERIAVCCGDGAEYRTDEWIAEMLRKEVACYSAYLQGSVYYYTIENADGEAVGGCGGFLVVDEADMEYLRSEARDEAETFASERRETLRRYAFGNLLT